MYCINYFLKAFTYFLNIAWLTEMSLKLPVQYIYIFFLIDNFLKLSITKINGVGLTRKYISVFLLVKYI